MLILTRQAAVSESVDVTAVRALGVTDTGEIQAVFLPAATKVKGNA